MVSKLGAIAVAVREHRLLAVEERGGNVAVEVVEFLALAVVDAAAEGDGLAGLELWAVVLVHRLAIDGLNHRAVRRNRQAHRRVAKHHEAAAVAVAGGLVLAAAGNLADA